MWLLTFSGLIKYPVGLELSHHQTHNVCADIAV